MLAWEPSFRVIDVSIEHGAIREVLGNRDRPGRTWWPGKDPIRVNCHTFTTGEQPVVIPSRIYGFATNTG